jgi:hypothetical protein
MSTFNSYQSGLHNVGSFQVSSRPYATASLNINPGPDYSNDPNVMEIVFDRVSKFVIVKNEVSVDLADAPIRLGFSENGVKGTNYILLFNDESFSADYKISRLYLMAHTAVSSSASVSAGMTGIPATQLGHNWSGSLGVG